MFQTKNAQGQNWRLEKRNFKRICRNKWEGGIKGFKKDTLKAHSDIPAAMSRYPATRRVLNWI